jgi:hypothetical protein
MQIEIKISPKESYNLEMGPVAVNNTDSIIYKLACLILSNLKAACIVAWQYILYIDKTLSKIDCYINAIPLRYAKIQSCGFSAINHAYKDAPLEQKKALEKYICFKLEQDKRFYDLAPQLRQTLAQKIATDQKIYDIGGLCLGYSWLFAAYVLSHKECLKNADLLKKSFLEDVKTKTCPIVSFATYVSIDNLIQRQGSKIVIQGDALRVDSASLEKETEAVNAIRTFAYPSFKLESDPKTRSGLVTDSEINFQEPTVLKMTLKDFLGGLKKSPPLKKEEREMTIEQKCLIASNLEEQILAYGKYFDKKSIVMGIPTKDPTSGHAMCIFADEETKDFVFFDPNIGITCFPSLKELAKGVSSFSKSMYGAKKADFLEAITI